MTDLQRKFGLIVVAVLVGAVLWLGTPDDSPAKMVGLLLVAGGAIAAVTNLMAKPDGD